MEPLKSIRPSLYPRGGTESSLTRTSQQLDDLAWLLDNCFKVPGLNWRFGLDSILGLIPGAGDLVSAVLGLFILVRALQFELPFIVVVRMLLNVLADFLFGSIPILGDALDFVWKSNSANMKLFHKHAKSPRAGTTRHWIYIGAVVGGITTVFVIIAAVVFYWTWHLLSALFP